MDGPDLSIVMEYASGGDLWKRICEAYTHFPEAQIVTWLRELCLGLQHIHSRHILHRDIKSQNVFLDADDHCKIGDFGISKMLDNTDDFAHTIVGSPFYLSPELCMGQPYDFATDIWSLGCVLYELCTLSPAFSGNNMGAIVAKIMRDRPPAIPSFYSKGLADLVDAMLNKSPKARPSLPDIVNFPVLKGEIPAIILEKKQRPKKARQKKQNGLAIDAVPLCVERQRQSPAVANRKRGPVVRSMSSRGRKGPPMLKDGANVSKFLVVKHLDDWAPEKKQERGAPPAGRAPAGSAASKLRRYLNQALGEVRVKAARDALMRDEDNEREALTQLGGEGNEKMIVLIRRLILSEEQLRG
jgi:serine/threonine protein kinase